MAAVIIAIVNIVIKDDQHVEKTCGHVTRRPQQGKMR